MKIQHDYDKALLKKLANSDWLPKEFNEDFMKLVRQVDYEVISNSVSGKIASIFVKHQVIHEFVKDLIMLSNLYLQGEIWPAQIMPKYDGGQEKMTGWYIDYYESNCIECKGKQNFLKEAKRVNEIRNKVAHNMIGKNDSVVNESYRKFEEHFQRAVIIYNHECCEALFGMLEDLARRVDFHSLQG